MSTLSSSAGFMDGWTSAPPFLVHPYQSVGSDQPCATLTCVPAHLSFTIKYQKYFLQVKQQNYVYVVFRILLELHLLANSRSGWKGVSSNSLGKKSLANPWVLKLFGNKGTLWWFWYKHQSRLHLSLWLWINQRRKLKIQCSLFYWAFTMTLQWEPSLQLC